MGRRCCITGCNSTSRLPEHHGVTYHSFPLDPVIRAVWIRNTRLNSERQITKSVLVCSRHFRRADFQPIRSGKYLLKHRIFPTVFPWGKVDPAQIEADFEELRASGNVTASSSGLNTSSTEDATKATVEATVAQIMAETAELNAAGGIKTEDDATTSAAAATSPAGVKFEPVTSFNPGTRLEAQDFDGIWHVARVVEVDNDDREVLIKFERTGKTKSNIVGTEEWIPMISNRLRQKVSTKPVPTFELEEKCMARWTGPRKFPGTVKKILGNDVYEVLFDDGYVKNVRAIHMNKMLPAEAEHITTTPAVSTPAIPKVTPIASTTAAASVSPVAVATPARAVAPKRESPIGASTSSNSKKRAASGTRRDWPLLDMSKLDLESLNLPEIPRDGEWTCYWVNDQPIGREGYLIVGEHRKPTVIVEDWRLPTGWVKHMYQRSNVLGKWDVILVTPGGKRFRSKADLKIFLEEQGQVYNPDIYDFSIHRRRAKDINAYAYTSDYAPQPGQKQKPLDTSLNISNMSIDSNSSTAAALSTTLVTTPTSKYIETPVATPMPPMELMTQTSDIKSNIVGIESTSSAAAELADVKSSTPIPNNALTGADAADVPVQDGYTYIGGLKVQIINNLFRCPQEGCSKNFRKENHLQIHVKHYHQDLIKLLGACPKMQELAEKRTHPITADQTELHPKNQIPNQQFFAKLYEQDQQQTRAHRKSVAAAEGTSETDIKNEFDIKNEESGIKSTKTVASDADLIAANNVNAIATDDTRLDESLADVASANNSGIPAKRSRFSPSKRTPGSRKSNRQRTTRRYLTAAQATGASLTPVVTADSSFGVSDFEETRHSFNATPDAKCMDVKKRHRSAAIAAPTTPISSVDSPVTADSGSSSFQPLLASASEADTGHPSGMSTATPQYIKENGELIKIVRMRQEEIINCLCSYGEEDGLMIQCELCLCWQHGICNGIDKESDVPDKYVCFICRNPQRARESMRFKHDQDWLYEGKLPVANYHNPHPDYQKRSEFLKHSHTLTGNLVELRRFMHSLRVKINIGNNRCHPKLYLWAKKWDDELSQQTSGDIKSEQQIKHENDVVMQSLDAKDKDISSISSSNPSPTKKIKSEPVTPARPLPNIPQPEAPIDPVECQHRLLEHIKVQQNLVMNRLTDIEAEIEELEKQDELPDLKDDDVNTVADVLATYIKELDTMKQIAKLSTLEHTKEAMKSQQFAA